MMKKSEIIACIKAIKKISDYELTITDKDSRELFYVKDHLELNRAVKVTTAQIVIYVSDRKKTTTGSSNVMVTAADDKKSLTEKLKKAVRKAGETKNAYYPINTDRRDIKEKIEKKKDLNQIATNVAKAVFKANVYKNGWINATEIFVSQFRDEFINSRGAHHKVNRFKIELECIPTWSNQKEEFELYKFYESNKADYKQITAEIDEILNLAKARSNALTLKDVKIPDDVKVLVKGEMVDRIVMSLANDLSYRSKFMRNNHYETADVISETPFDLTLKGSIAGCAASRKIDSHGIILKSCKVIQSGRANKMHGDLQFGHYLSVEKITGNMPVCELTAEGSTYKRSPHLIIDAFSSPQLEADSGYWGGEVRLARYWDGKKYVPLTGFSIAGSLYEDLKSVQFSKEEGQTSRYKGPQYMIFRGIKIS